MRNCNKFSWLIWLSALFYALSLSGAEPKQKKPLISKVRDTFSNQVLTNRRLNQLTDITVTKVYDQYKWQRTISRAKKYQRAHPMSQVAEIDEPQINAGAARFSLKTKNGKQGWMMISFPFPDAVRVQAGLGQRPKIETRGENMQFESQPDAIILKSSQVKIQIQKKSFRIEFYDLNGKKILAETKNIGLELSEGLCRESFDLAADEKIIGLGEQYGRWDHRGTILVMDQDDAYESKTGNTYLPLPFFISSRPYGLLLNTTQAAVFDLGKSDNNRLSLENPNSNIDYILFLSPEPEKMLAEFGAFNGRSPIIPRWSLEPWISRQSIIGWRDYRNAEQDVDRMLSQNFPFGVVLYENLLSGSRDGPSLGIDPDSKPGMPEIIDRWHQLGLKVVGWTSIGQIDPRPEIIKYYGFDRHPEYLVRNPDGSFYMGGIDRNMLYIDVTNPEAMDFAWQKIYGPLFESGPDGKTGYRKTNLDGIKLDFCEFFPRDDEQILVHNRAPGLKLYQPTYFSEWIYGMINRVRPEGGITWIRGAGLGAQRTGFVWPGDRGRTFSQLKHTHIARMNACASGIALIGTDLGGYSGGGVFEEQVYNRAAAIDCFSPAFQDHGRSVPPWEQSERGKNIYRFYARLRYNLIPYIYHLVWQAHETGLPIMRPMFFQCYTDKKCWEIYDQYFLGDSLLVAPVFSNAGSRMVYLPAGRWIDFWTRKIFEGPKNMNYPAALNIIPVFAKAGAVIPVQFNNEFELGGAFKQEEKDRLIPGFLVFAENELTGDFRFQVFDLRKTTDTETRLNIAIRNNEINIQNIEPAPAGILVYGSKPAKVSFSGIYLKETDCKNILNSSAWCFREKDKATIAFIKKK